MPKTKHKIYFSIYFLATQKYTATFIIDSSNSENAVGDLREYFRGYIYTPSNKENKEKQNATKTKMERNNMIIQDWLTVFHSYFHLWKEFFEHGAEFTFKIMYDCSPQMTQALYDGLIFYLADITKKYPKSKITFDLEKRPERYTFLSVDIKWYELQNKFPYPFKRSKSLYLLLDYIAHRHLWNVIDESNIDKTKQEFLEYKDVN